MRLGGEPIVAAVAAGDGLVGGGDAVVATAPAATNFLQH